MSSYYIIQNDELYHHGIKGQKHGERRYQYKDGTLTPLGRIRYRKMKKQYEKQKEAAEYNELKKQLTETRPTVNSIKNLSNEELDTLYKRLTLESNYLTVYDKLHPKKEPLMTKIFSTMKDKAVNELSDMAVKKGRAYLESKFSNPAASGNKN